MNPVITVIIIVAVVVIGALLALYFVGKRLEKKQAESETQMKAASQTVSILVIDKKKMKLREAGLPQAVVEQTPKYLRRSKVPVVKAKIGPQVMSLICDAKIFPLIPTKREVKAVISGIYIMDVRGLRKGLDKDEKVGFFDKLKSKVSKKASKGK